MLLLLFLSKGEFELADQAWENVLIGYKSTTWQSITLYPNIMSPKLEKPLRRIHRHDPNMTVDHPDAYSKAHFLIDSILAKTFHPPVIVSDVIIYCVVVRRTGNHIIFLMKTHLSESQYSGSHLHQSRNQRGEQFLSSLCSYSFHWNDHWKLVLAQCIIEYSRMRKIRRGDKRGAILDSGGEFLLDLADEVATSVDKARIDIYSSAHVVDSRWLSAIGKENPTRITYGMVNRNAVASTCEGAICKHIKSKVA